MKKSLLIAGFSLAAFFQGAALAQDVTSAQMPAIELVGSNTVALGPISSYEFKRVNFTFRNPGAAPVEIVKVTSTCPCVRGYPETAVLKPKEEAVITLELNPTLVHGTFKRQVWVQTTDPLQKRIGLYVTGQIKSLFNGLPMDTLLVRTSTVDETWTNRFTLTATETNLFLGTPEIPSNGNFRLTATLTTNEAAKRSYEVTLVATPLTEGRSSTMLSIPVQGRPGLPPLRVTVQARIGTELGVTPKRLLVVPSGEILMRRLLVQTAETNANPASLTWTPQREGVTFDVKATRSTTSLKKSSNLTVTLVITPKAAAELLKETDPKLTFAYPHYKPVTLDIIRTLPLTDGAEPTP